MTALKLITLNIEGDNHLDRVIPFLKKEDADAVCLQEVFQADTKLFEKELGMKSVFAPMMNNFRKKWYDMAPRGFWGIAIFSKYNFQKNNSYNYFGSALNIPEPSDDPNCVNRVLLTADIEKDKQKFTIAATHFIWSVNGTSTPLQMKGLDGLFAALDQVGDCVLCGDFNAPRGLETYRRIAQKFKDNIPPEVVSTLDANLHKVKNLKYVVDYIFSSPSYEVNDVKVAGGVSDHKAIVANVLAI